MSKFLHKPTTPFKIAKFSNIADLLNAMRNISFQERSPARCFPFLAAAPAQEAKQLAAERRKSKFELGRKLKFNF